jgi:3-oxoacyl-[acyl-carrier-protein] synthase II
VRRGAVTPVGNDAETTWQSLLAGRSGIGTITTFAADTFPVRIAGMVRDFELDPDIVDGQRLRRLSRPGSFGVAAAAEALRDANVADAPYAPEERAVALGGSVGRPDLELVGTIAQQWSTDKSQLVRQAPSEVLGRDQNVAAAMIASLASADGPMISVSTACTASTHAIGEAYRRIQDGDARMIVTGGYDSLTTWMDVLGFALLGALAKEYNDDPERASRPFERDRSGFVLGEGAVMAVFEDWDSAKERGARIYGEMVGYGSSMNAYRMTDAPADGSGPDLAIAGALEESKLGTDGVDYVVAHGTGTHGNDISETVALKKVFGDDAYRLAISSPKSMTGHLTAAAGALSLLCGVLAIRDQVVPPTINLDNPDPELDLDYVPNEARETRVRASLVNGFAFGGTNAALMIREPEGAGV